MLNKALQNAQKKKAAQLKKKRKKVAVVKGKKAKAANPEPKTKAKRGTWKVLLAGLRSVDHKS